MTADARMIFVESSGKEARTTSVGRFPLARWVGHLPAKAPISWRTADVGVPILSEVMIVTHAEAMVATAAMRAEAERGTGVDIPRDADVIRFCEQLEVFLATPKPVDKFVGSSRVDLQACKLEYSIVSPK